MTGDTDTRRIGMATSDPYTTDNMLITTMEEEFVDDISLDNKLIMRELNRQRLLMLFSLMGAVLGNDRDGFLFLKYWKRISVLNRCSQVITRKPVAYFSGFCSCHRGLHWRRNNGKT